MLYTEATMKAMCLAYNAHHGQLDKGGAPYINHPFHVAESMHTESETVAALLHDVVEDTPITLSDLKKEGFPAEAIEAVRLLTKQDGIPYDVYIQRVKENPIARAVKIADIQHNMDLSRVGFTEATAPDHYLTRRKKYARALETLQNE